MARPGRCQPTVLEKLGVAPSILFGNPLSTIPRVLTWTGEWSRRDLLEPHWHLGPVAVESRLQGQGVGTVMIDDFCARMDQLFAEHELILLPSTPVARLEKGADHSQTRARLLRYTSPFSLAGVPVVAIPCAIGGMQLAAPQHADESLLALAARIGEQRNSPGT